MEMTQIEPGQNWLNNINENFTKLGVQDESTTAYVLLNGVTQFSDTHTPIIKRPLLSGSTEKTWHLGINIKHMPVHSDLAVAKVPEGFQEVSDPWIGIFPVGQDGHVVGALSAYFANSPKELHLFYDTMVANPTDLNNTDVNLPLTWH